MDNRQKIVGGFLIGILILIPLLQVGTKKPFQADSRLAEDVVCLNGICTVQSDGTVSCNEIKPQYARIFVSSDITPSDEKRLEIRLLGKQCNTE